MADLVFNIAKGRVAEYLNRVDSNDPANSAIIVIPLDRGATTDATFRDHATGAAVIAAATERTTGGWNRKTFTDADLAALAVDNVNDRMPATVPAGLWTAVTGGALVVTDLLFAYDSDTTGGTDANLIPLVLLAFPVTPTGADEGFNAGDIFRAA